MSPLALQESGEMYLETILLLQKEMEQVRSIDVANEMHLSRASVSRAMRQLKDYNYILIEENGVITLTPAGQALATSIYERHILLTDFFTTIGVDLKTASEDACRIEHVISDAAFEKLKQHLKTIQ